MNLNSSENQNNNSEQNKINNTFNAPRNNNSKRNNTLNPSMLRYKNNSFEMQDSNFINNEKNSGLNLDIIQEKLYQQENCSLALIHHKNNKNLILNVENLKTFYVNFVTK